jgi:lysophospholipase L1-like esterase
MNIPGAFSPALRVFSRQLTGRLGHPATASVLCLAVWLRTSSSLCGASPASSSPVSTFTAEKTYIPGVGIDSPSCRLKEFAFEKYRSAVAGEPTNAREAAKQQQAPSGITGEMVTREAKRKATMTPEQLAWEQTLEANLGNFYLPLYYKDKDDGRETAWDYVPDNPALPRMLIIGDSISRGYTLAVRHALAGKVNVHRAPANCGPTATGLAKLDAWLGADKWDLITWNFGIHDRHTEPALYRKNLDLLLGRLKKTGAKIIWVRTTPAPPSGKNNEGFTDALCDQVNQAADGVMQANEVPEVDLYSLLKPALATTQLPDNVHFKEAGYEVMGRALAGAVMVELQKHK